MSSTACTSETPSSEFAELVSRGYDLFLVCGLDVPWAHDSIREFDDQRRWMHEEYVSRAERSGSPWLLLEGKEGERLTRAREFIDETFGNEA